MSRRKTVITLTVLFSLTVAIISSYAALPVKMDGEKLPSLAPMLEDVTPAVVNIATEGRIQLQQNPLFSDPFFRRFFDFPDRPVERKIQSLGSGVIVDADRGIVLTNNHVVANADQITVTLRDGRHLEAELVGTDPETDVAVIKIPSENLIHLKTADSDNLRVGDFVIAIGNPFGLGQTVTSGIVSALSRSGLGIEGYEDFIQTDASINPGNSGGALVNLNGELVGINTAIFSRSGGNIGIGFAIPINLALNVMEQLLETGEVKRGFLGVYAQDLDPELAEAFGLSRQTGAIINKILPGSPAEEAGLKTGDIVTRIDGKGVRNAADVKNRIGLLNVGDVITFDILRDGKPMIVKAEIAESQQGIVSPSSVNNRLQGMTVSDIKPDHPLYGKLRGVIIIDLERGSRSWRSGLRPGDVITSVNNRDITSLKEFLAVVDKQEGRLVLRIVRGNGAAFVVIK
ncbi:MAG TPA: DegQ family serine endoprotease [Gammaproteobacteria bacterium]|nr:DegQ family serine endoprotease [Gammaproteobacteria bacterium]